MSEQVRGRGVITPLAVYISHGETVDRGEKGVAFYFLRVIWGITPPRIAFNIPRRGCLVRSKPSRKPEAVRKPEAKKPIQSLKTARKSILPCQHDKIHIKKPQTERSPFFAVIRHIMPAGKPETWIIPVSKSPQTETSIAIATFTY